MTSKNWLDIIKRHVDAEIKEKGMKRRDLSDYEYMKWKLDMAVKLLMRL
jgi:predicted metal-binding transcription factor (methanogenesis marker protein 9)